MPAQRILIVENNTSFRTQLSDMLKRVGFQVDAAKDLITAASFCDDKTYHLALVDLSLGSELLSTGGENYANKDGTSLVEMIKAKKEGTRVVVLSGHPDPQVSANVLQRHGADYFLAKDSLLRAKDLDTAILDVVNEQMLKARLNLLDGHENTIRCITHGEGADIWRHNAIQALRPGLKDRQLEEVLLHLLERVGPARRRKRTQELLSVHGKGQHVSGLFWSKAFGCAVFAALAGSLSALDAAIQTSGLEPGARALHIHHEQPVLYSVFASGEPRSEFVEP